jgi:carboxylate-amine ligase
MSKPKFSLFQAFGVEMEYMIVDKDTLAVKSIADKLIFEAAGDFTSEVLRGEMAWSNELVSHVIEVKCLKPASTMIGLQRKFWQNVREINERLEKHNAMLLPTGAHPLMNPYKEAKIWEHEYNEIYSLYDKIFDCKGHGWVNLQSTHINLPFANDEEFGRLHAAIRLLLPIIPALSASTPILDGKLTNYLDARLEAYRHNQEKIPSIAGKVIPEQIFTQKDYEQNIFQRIMKDVKPYDTEGILDKHFLNSRGAIARFDRGAIEIRIIDIQECPKADMGILLTIVAALKHLISEKWASYEAQKQWHEDDLSKIFLEVIEYGAYTYIGNEEYLKLFGIKEGGCQAKDVWKHIIEQVSYQLDTEALQTVNFILENDTLARRIVRKLKGDFSKENIQSVYKQLAECLAYNQLFEVN